MSEAVPDAAEHSGFLHVSMPKGEALFGMLSLTGAQPAGYSVLTGDSALASGSQRVIMMWCHTLEALRFATASLPAACRT